MRAYLIGLIPFFAFAIIFSIYSFLDNYYLKKQLKLEAEQDALQAQEKELEQQKKYELERLRALNSGDLDWVRHHLMITEKER